MSIFDGERLAWDTLPERQETAYAWDWLPEPRKHAVIADANVLDEAARRARMGTNWKESVQRFWWNRLARISSLQRALDALEDGREGAYEPDEGYEFMLNERGRTRPICGQKVDDRVVSHAVNDAVLIPAIRPYLIYDNSASLEGRGVDFARRRMKAQLERYYAREGTNRGYIRLKDQSKYYDNIRHGTLREILRTFTDDALALKVADRLLSKSRLDVSYMTEAEYARAMEEKIDRVAYRMAGHPREGRKWLEKGMNVGDQLSQTAGIVYPWHVDQLAKTVLGSKYYQRYMDDSCDIDRSLEELKRRAREIDRAADGLGMYTNERKTVIARIDKGFVHLQRKIRLLDDGTVLVRLRPKAVTRIKRRIRKATLKEKVKNGQIPVEDLVNMVKSWTHARRDCLTYMQLRSIEKTVLKEYGREAYEQVYDHAEKWKATGRPGP